MRNRQYIELKPPCIKPRYKAEVNIGTKKAQMGAQTNRRSVREKIHGVLTSHAQDFLYIFRHTHNIC